MTDHMIPAGEAPLSFQSLQTYADTLQETTILLIGHLHRLTGMITGLDMIADENLPHLLRFFNEHEKKLMPVASRAAFTEWGLAHFEHFDRLHARIGEAFDGLMTKLYRQPDRWPAAAQEIKAAIAACSGKTRSFLEGDYAKDIVAERHTSRYAVEVAAVKTLTDEIAGAIHGETTAGRPATLLRLSPQQPHA